MRNMKSKLSKSIAVALVAALAISGIPGASLQAAKKAKLATKKITITVGKTKSIKIKNKAKKATYTYKVKNTKIAKVSKKGVVSGKKAGKTTITVSEKLKGKKKVRKLGTVSVTVSKKPSTTTSKAPVTSKAPGPSAPAVSKAPTEKTPDVSSLPSGSPKPSKTPRPSPTPKPSPTIKPTPTVDPFTPEGEGWMKLDLSQWTGGNDNLLETGGQIVLNDTEQETMPIPNPVVTGGSVEVLIRGSVPSNSQGFRFWLSNEATRTMTNQFCYTAEKVGLNSKVTGEAVFTPIDSVQFKPGENFQIQTVLTNENFDGESDTTATRFHLKAYTYGGTLDGTIITSIFIRYSGFSGGPATGPAIEEPTGPAVEIITPSAYTVDFSQDIKQEGGNNAKQTINEDKTATLTFSAYTGVNYILPNTPEIQAAEFKYMTITYTSTVSEITVYPFDGTTDLAKPNLSQNSPCKHEATNKLLASTDEKTVTYAVTDSFKDYDFSKGTFRGVQFFGWGNTGTLNIKSIVFSKELPN